MYYHPDIALAVAEARTADMRRAAAERSVRAQTRRRRRVRRWHTAIFNRPPLGNATPRPTG